MRPPMDDVSEKVYTLLKIWGRVLVRMPRIDREHDSLEMHRENMGITNLLKTKMVDLIWWIVEG